MNKPRKRKPLADSPPQIVADLRVQHGYSRPPLARMQRLHEMLSSGRYPNCRKLAEEFEVSAKTVQRDINFMRDQMSLPIEYDKGRFGFRYTRPVSGFPAIGIPNNKAVSSNKGNPWRKSSPAQVGEDPTLPDGGRPGAMIRVRFDPESARIVRAKTWHPTQILYFLPNGGVEVVLRIHDEWALARWILSWGAHAWIVEPARLRNRVKEIARQIIALH